MDGFFRGGGFPFGNLGGHMHDDRAEVAEWYNILQVEENCSERELTQAWRKFVRANHPDRGGDPDLFKSGQAAYEGLQEKKKRGSGGTVSMSQQKPEVITHRLRIDLEDVCEGGSKTVEVKIKVAEERNVCPKCNGRGTETKIVRHGPVMMQTQCHCSRCRGQGISYVGERMETNEVSVYIPPGTKQGDKLSVTEEGHNLPGLARGDVKFDIHINNHPVYKRIQADLAMTKGLNLMETLQGYNFIIPSIIRGEFLRVQSKGEIAQPGDVICVEGQGLPQKGNRGVRGNLYIRFNIVLPEPKSFDENQLAQLKKILGNSRIKYNMPGEEMNETREFHEGAKVRLTGLLNKPDLNGCGGRIVQENFRPDTHAVLLDNGKTVAVREEMLEFSTKQKVSRKKKQNTPKKSEYCQTFTGVKVDDPDNIKYTETGGHSELDDDERGGMGGRGGGVDCQQM